MVVESIAKLIDALYAHEVVENHADNLRPIRKYPRYSHSYMIFYCLCEHFSEQKRRNKLAYLREYRYILLGVCCCFHNPIMSVMRYNCKHLFYSLAVTLWDGNDRKS